MLIRTNPVSGKASFMRSKYGSATARFIGETGSPKKARRKCQSAVVRVHDDKKEQFANGPICNVNWAPFAWA